MKTFFKILFIFFILASTSILLSENSIIELNKSRDSSRINVEIKTNKSLSQTGDLKEKIVYPIINVVVKYKKLKVGDVETENLIEIDLSKVDFDSGVNPFNKKIILNFEKEFAFEYSYKSDITDYRCNHKGKLKFVGDWETKGLSSSNKFENKVIETVMKKVYESVKNKLAKA